MDIYKELQTNRGRKLFALLIDPDKHTPESLGLVIGAARECGTDLIFVGGSLLTYDHLEATISQVKESCDIPVVLFPGSLMQISRKADALLLLSMISGRNADLLIGHHVIAAPYLKSSGLEILPTGYMLIEGGTATTAQYISNTMPIPRKKNDVAICTAMAGEMLGLRLIYMDAGSGADQPVPVSMIREVKENINIPLIVGGGIREPEQARDACTAGADIIVVGNAIEKDPSGIRDLANAVHFPG